MVFDISARLGDITEEEVDAVVNPANSYGSMGGGVAWAIRSVGGEVIEREAIERGPTPVGEAIATTAGRLPAGFVIHAPTMESPAQRIGRDNVLKATCAALECAARLGVRSIAFPGMGTGVGGVPKRDAADTMVEAIRGFVKPGRSSLERIVLVAFDHELFEAFESSLKNVRL